ncbi:MAG: pitrilysin family protein [Gammaproteobacteria bacterium]
MKNLILTSGFLAALVLPTLAGANEMPPPGGEPKDFSLAEPVRFELDNGLSATLLEFGTAPKATIYVSLAAGAVNEGEATWLSSLTGDMLKEGTENYTALELAETAGAMGGGLSVGSGDESTTVYIDVLSEHAADAVKLVAEVLQRPTFPASELDRIKRDYLRSLAVNKQQPQALASQAYSKLLYGDHPFAGEWPTEAQLAAYTIEDVRDFYEGNFGAQRARIYVAGVFDQARVKAAITEAFGGWARGPQRVIDIPADPAAPGVALVDRPGAPQATIRLGLKTIDPSDPAWTKLVFTNTLLGGFFSSRVTENIREDKGYTYSPRSSLASHYRDGYWTQSADVSIEHTGDSLREIYGEIYRLRNEAPGADEIERVRNFMTGSFIRSNASRLGILGLIAFIDYHGLPREYLTEYASRVGAITAEDVRMTTEKYLVPEDMSLAVVGDLSQVRPQLETLPQLEGRLPD